MINRTGAEPSGLGVAEPTEVSQLPGELHERDDVGVRRQSDGRPPSVSDTPGSTYGSELADRQVWRQLEMELHERDHEPAYADAPVLDAYARLSHNPNTGDTEKTDRQLVDILREVQRRHACLGEVLSDDNKSAWRRDRKRPGWDRLMERLRSGQSQGVVAWHTDRLMQQPKDLEQLIEFAEGNYAVGSCFGDKDISSADGQFVLRIEVAAACKASDDASRRIKRKKRALREQGYLPAGGKVFGWNEDGSLHPVESEAIGWAVAQVLMGATLASVAQEWGRRGIGSFRGPNIRQFLVRPRNAALIVVDGRVLREAVDAEPIITQDQWERLNVLFAGRRRGRPHDSQKYLLTRSLYCAACGYRMNGTQAHSGQGREYYSAYRCTGCRTTTIRADSAEGLGSGPSDQASKRPEACPSDRCAIDCLGRARNPARPAAGDAGPAR